jgi:hypothetical protein
MSTTVRLDNNSCTHRGQEVCNTTGATKALDVTNVCSLMPEYKTQHKKPNVKVKARKQQQGQNSN